MPLFARSILCYNVSDMILVTGGTGFIGRALIKKLVSQKRPVRLLLNPSPKSPNLPKGVAIDVAVSSLKDERGLRAAMKDVDTVFHLAGSERRGIHADLEGTDIDGSQCISRVSADANISRFFFLSHLGADRASAFAVLKAKAIAEGYIVRSGVDYTIFQTAAVFGPGDQFTCPLASLLRLSPGIFLIPGKGDSILQPLYIDDLVACLCLALDDPTTINQTYQLGGGEYISFLQILHILLEKIKKRRFII